MTAGGVLPTFLVIGTMKGGTSSLDKYLRTHPQVCMPTATKELHFFTGGLQWEAGPSWYSSQFAPHAGTVAVGEVSPSYAKASTVPGVPGRVASLIPGVKLVYVVRHPIERMRAHWLHFAASGRRRIAPIDEELRSNPAYLMTSSYAWQLGHYLEHFDREQILLVRSDDLHADRLGTVQRIYRFIGVDDAWVPPNLGLEANRSAQKLIVRPRARALVSSRLFGAVERRAPAGVRRRMTDATRMSAADARLAPDTIEWATARLQDDLRQLGHHMPADFDAWGLLSE
jgi:hypothetical protein